MECWPALSGKRWPFELQPGTFLSDLLPVVKEKCVVSPRVIVDQLSAILAEPDPVRDGPPRSFWNVGIVTCTAGRRCGDVRGHANVHGFLGLIARPTRWPVAFGIRAAIADPF